MERKKDDGGPEGPAARSTTDYSPNFLAKLGRTAEPEKRLLILRTCARLDFPWVETLLWESVSDPCEYVRDYLVRELTSRPEVRRENAVNVLGRPPWYGKCAALKIIRNRKMAEIVPYLADLVEDPNVEIRRNTAEALGEIGGEGALRLLVKLRKDPNQLVKTAAEKAISSVSGVRFT